MDPKLASIDSMTGEDVREWWQLSYVTQFCYVFRPAFSFPDFLVEDLEESLLNPGENGSTEWKLICDIHVRMLRGIMPNRGVNAENWQEHLRKLMRGKTKRSKAPSISEDDTNENSHATTDNIAMEQTEDSDSPKQETVSGEGGICDEQWNPLGERADYRSISLRDKVAILFLLCEMRLDGGDVHDALKGWEGDYLRLQPLGTDRHGNRYWFMDSGMRLYKESTPKVDLPPDEEEEERPAKKAKAKRGRGRPKKSSSSASPADKSHARSKRSSFRNAVSKISSRPESDSDDDAEASEKKEAAFPPTLSLSTALLGNWTVAASTQEEWDDLTDRFARSRNADERELGKFIRSEIIEEVTRKRTLREKQQRKKQLLDSMPRRASDRITIMKVTREEEVKQASLRREVAEEERRHAEEERQRRMADSRRELREKRLLVRTEKAAGNGESPPTEHRQGPPYGMNEEKYDWMYAILEAVRRTNHAWLFEDPVADEIAPNYSLIVKRPMELATVERKLDDYAYKHSLEFVEDLRVMCANCRLYNGPRSQYFKMADQVEAAVKRQMAKFFPRVEWGDSPVLPPSDPLPPIPKPVKRKSLTSDDTEVCPPTKLRSPLSQPMLHEQPKSEGSSPEPLNTLMSRQQPVAAHMGQFVNANHQFPPFSKGPLAARGAAAAGHPPATPLSAVAGTAGTSTAFHRPDMKSAPGVGAWGSALSHRYNQSQQPSYQSAPNTPVPRWQSSIMAGALPGAAGPVPRYPAALASSRTHPVVNGQVATAQFVASPRPAGMLRGDSSSQAAGHVPAASSRGAYVRAPVSSSHPGSGWSATSASAPRPMFTDNHQPGYRSPGGAMTNGRPPSVSAPGMSALRHASRPLSAAGPVPRAPVALATNLQSMSRPLSASTQVFMHPAAVPRPRAPLSTSSSDSRLSSSSSSISSPPPRPGGTVPLGAQPAFVPAAQRSAFADLRDHSGCANLGGTNPTTTAASTALVPSPAASPQPTTVPAGAEPAVMPTTISSAVPAAATSSHLATQPVTARPPPTSCAMPQSECDNKSEQVPRSGSGPGRQSSLPATAAAAAATTSESVVDASPAAHASAFSATDALDQLAAVSARASPVNHVSSDADVSKLSSSVCISAAAEHAAVSAAVTSTPSPVPAASGGGLVNGTPLAAPLPGVC